MSRSRCGAVERLSVRGRRCDPPWPPFCRGGKDGRGFRWSGGASSGSLAGDAFWVECGACPCLSPTAAGMCVAICLGLTPVNPGAHARESWGSRP